MDQPVGIFQQPGRVVIGGGHLKGLRGDDVPEGLVFHGILRQQGHVIGSGIVVFIMEAVGVDKVGVHHADLRGLFIHQVGKFLLAARQIDGQRAGGVVAGYHHGAVKQVDNADLLIPGQGKQKGCR